MREYPNSLSLSIALLIGRMKGCAWALIIKRWALSKKTLKKI